MLEFGLPLSESNKEGSRVKYSIAPTRWRARSQSFIGLEEVGVCTGESDNRLTIGFRGSFEPWFFAGPQDEEVRLGDKDALPICRLGMWAMEHRRGQ